MRTTSKQPSQSRPIAIFGATGRQGGATARALLSRGLCVRAITRSPGSDPARKLFQQGAEIVYGDMDDSDSLDQAIAGTMAVFSVQNFWEPGYEQGGREREVRQGKAVISAALRHKVSHFVQASVVGADRASNVPHFDSKHEVEKALKASGLKWTILRAGPFMQDFEYEKDDILRGRLQTWPIDPDTIVKFSDTETIGRVAAAVLSHPDQYVGTTLPVVCDSILSRDMAGVFTRSLGITVESTPMSWQDFEDAVGKELTVMFKFFQEHGIEGNPEDTRLIVPNAPTLFEFARRLPWIV